MAARPQIVGYDIRPMVVGDLSTIMDIETRVYPFPWTQRIFSDCLRVGYYCRVCQYQGELVAYVIASVGAGEAHILNLCVDPAYQGQGIGRVMLQGALDQLQEDRIESVFLEVRPSNAVAMRLYYKLGFNEIGRRPGYYPALRGREDALIFALSLYLGKR